MCITLQYYDFDYDNDTVNEVYYYNNNVAVFLLGH